jgi:hypothetical protein
MFAEMMGRTIIFRVVEVSGCEACSLSDGAGGFPFEVRTEDSVARPLAVEVGIDARHAVRAACVHGSAVCSEWYHGLKAWNTGKGRSLAGQVDVLSLLVTRRLIIRWDSMTL